jgi:hypothetical protein
VTTLRHGAAQSGAGMLEMLLALPVLLLFGLGIAQFTLVYQAKHALDYALMQAARQGAVDHASAESIERGLASGLVPYLYGASDWGGLLQAEARAVAHVASGISDGWIQLRQRSPTRDSFQDWGEQALDAMGYPIAGMVEIANDNLDSRRLRMQPASGVAGMRSAEAIGNRSGQTLADANLLRLELVYGVRLVVPVAGALVIGTLARWHACPPAPEARPLERRLGLLQIAEPEPLAARQGWICAFLGARDEAGRAAGRIPIRASATMRMMSPSRVSKMTATRVDVAGEVPAGRRPLGSGPLVDEAPAPPGRGRPPGGATIPGSAMPLANGFLAIGSNRAYPQPAPHPALCDG